MNRTISARLVKSIAVAAAAALLGGCCLIPGLELRENSLGEGSPPPTEVRSAEDGQS